MTYLNIPYYHLKLEKTKNKVIELKLNKNIKIM